MVQPIENRFHKTIATAALWGACCGWCLSRPTPPIVHHRGSGAPTVVVIER